MYRQHAGVAEPLHRFLYRDYVHEQKHDECAHHEQVCVPGNNQTVLGAGEYVMFSAHLVLVSEAFCPRWRC